MEYIADGRGYSTWGGILSVNGRWSETMPNGDTRWVRGLSLRTTYLPTATRHSDSWPRVSDAGDKDRLNEITD